MRHAALLAALLACGCSKPRTETVVVISTSGLRVPIDVDSVHILVTDRAPSGDDGVFEVTQPLCHDSLQQGCLALPITLTLFPGPERPGDSVRVRLDAIKNGATVIADSALFTFAEGQSLRLDLVLWANCLGNVSCAERDLACGPDNRCVPVTPQPFTGALDLAQAPEDLGVGGPDLAPPPDLGSLTDLTIPPLDLTLPPPDLAGTQDLIAPPSDLSTAPLDLISSTDLTQPPPDLSGSTDLTVPPPDLSDSTDLTTSPTDLLMSSSDGPCGGLGEACCPPPALPCTIGSCTGGLCQ